MVNSDLVKFISSRTGFTESQVRAVLEGTFHAFGGGPTPPAQQVRTYDAEGNDRRTTVVMDGDDPCRHLLLTLVSMGLNYYGRAQEADELLTAAKRGYTGKTPYETASDSLRSEE